MNQNLRKTKRFKIGSFRAEDYIPKIFPCCQPPKNFHIFHQKTANNYIFGYFMSHWVPHS